MFCFNVLLGPGCSSLGAGAFVENGPFRPKGNVLILNEFSWNNGLYYVYMFLNNSTLITCAFRFGWFWFLSFD